MATSPLSCCTRGIATVSVASTVPASRAVSDSAALGAALRAAHAACGAKLIDLEKVFCAPAPGVVRPDASLRAGYDRLEAELARALA